MVCAMCDFLFFCLCFNLQGQTEVFGFAYALGHVKEVKEHILFNLKLALSK